MRTVLLFLFLCVAGAFGQVPWAQRSRVRHHTEFFSQVIQETIYELERRGFSSLTLLNINRNIDDRMYRWEVNGTVHYSDGFVVSIQKIDVTAMTQSVGAAVINEVSTPRAVVGGTLNLRDIKLGYDVTFHQVNGFVQKFTGDFTHVLITWAISIQKNLATKEVTVSMTAGTSGGLIRMVYRPANHLTEVISRHFWPFDNTAGVRTWANTIGPIILDVIRNKIPFPDICYSHC